MVSCFNLQRRVLWKLTDCSMRKARARRAKMGKDGPKGKGKKGVGKDGKSKDGKARIRHGMQEKERKVTPRAKVMEAMTTRAKARVERKIEDATGAMELDIWPRIARVVSDRLKRPWATLLHTDRVLLCRALHHRCLHRLHLCRALHSELRGSWRSTNIYMESQCST